MPGTRSSSKTTPTSSLRSVKSTPKKLKTTPLKSSTSRRSRVSAGKTSPYFTKTEASKQNGRTKKSRVKVKDDEDDEQDSATGLTETSSSSSDAASEDAFDPESSVADEPIESDLDSDFLDEKDDFDPPSAKRGKKRNGTGRGGGSATKNRVKPRGIEGYDDEEFEDDAIELDEGQVVAGRIYSAPGTGQVPPGQISRNTMNFLKNLQIPERNDRDWFRAHEPSFRQAEKEWQAFVGRVQLKFHEADDEVPILPPKDVIHRIYRDVRFSSDKTPYKKSFSMSTSRGGRKGLWAGYHLSISPNDRSIMACGVWQPGKNEIATIRHHFLTEPDQFREVIAAPRFVELFGPAKPHTKGKKRNVFGHDDELKVAPKGIDKGHKDIDLLKLRSVAVVCHFTDDEVLGADFQDRVGQVVEVTSPFVHTLNDFISLPINNDPPDQ